MGCGSSSPVKLPEKCFWVLRLKNLRNEVESMQSIDSWGVNEILTVNDKLDNMIVILDEIDLAINMKKLDKAKKSEINLSTKN